MGEVERFDTIPYKEDMEPHKKGEWVRYSDYEQEINRLTAEIEVLKQERELARDATRDEHTRAHKAEELREYWMHRAEEAERHLAPLHRDLSQTRQLADELHTQLGQVKCKRDTYWVEKQSAECLLVDVREELELAMLECAEGTVTGAEKAQKRLETLIQRGAKA
jgi:uncharacterized membrane protein YgaE (UPF0421/DUF939 family)